VSVGAIGTCHVSVSSHSKAVRCECEQGWQRWKMTTGKTGGTTVAIARISRNAVHPTSGSRATTRINAMAASRTRALTT